MDAPTSPVGELCRAIAATSFLPGRLLLLVRYDNEHDHQCFVGCCGVGDKTVFYCSVPETFNRERRGLSTPNHPDEASGKKKKKGTPQSTQPRDRGRKTKKHSLKPPKRGIEEETKKTLPQTPQTMHRGEQIYICLPQTTQTRHRGRQNLPSPKA